MEVGFDRYVTVDAARRATIHYGETIKTYFYI